MNRRGFMQGLLAGAVGIIYGKPTKGVLDMLQRQPGMLENAAHKLSVGQAVEEAHERLYEAGADGDVLYMSTNFGHLIVVDTTRGKWAKVRAELKAENEV